MFQWTWRRLLMKASSTRVLSDRQDNSPSMREESWRFSLAVNDDCRMHISSLEINWTADNVCSSDLERFILTNFAALIKMNNCKNCIRGILGEFHKNSKNRSLLSSSKSARSMYRVNSFLRIFGRTHSTVECKRFEIVWQYLQIGLSISFNFILNNLFLEIAVRLRSSKCMER